MAKCPSRTSTGCGGGGGGGGGRGESGGNWDENDSDDVNTGTVLAVRRRSNGQRSRQSDLPGPCSVCRTLHGQARNEQARLFNLGCVRQTAICIRGYSKTKGRSSELCAAICFHVGITTSAVLPPRRQQQLKQRRRSRQSWAKNQAGIGRIQVITIQNR